jgi:hypothetical protein
MAKLKDIKRKDKKYIFTAYGNNKCEKPAKVIFDRFPLPDESFYSVDKVNLVGGLDIDELQTKTGKEKFVDSVVNNLIKNMQAGRVDHEEFVKRCISGFEDFEYNGKPVETVDDFFSLPPGAVYKIAVECYEYANQEDEFTMGEK